MKKTILVSFVALCIVKIVVAYRLDLFGDEAFYWQCGQRLALAFVDHPPLTALLIRLAVDLFGNSTLVVRLPFLILGAAIPFAVYWLARPLVGDRDAWLAAGASLLIPGFALFGFIAFPDVPVMVFGLCLMASFERATRTGSIGAWIVAGVAAGLGFLTHYRFVLFPAAAFVYLVISKKHRAHWRQPGVWIGAVPIVAGLSPTLLDNLQNEFAPIRYYLASRHGASFQLDAALEFLAAQAGVITPVLLMFFLATLWWTFKSARRGDDRAQLMLCFSLAYLGVFFAASPFEVSGLMTLHWPLPGYLALLPFLPGTLRGFAEAGSTRWRPVVAVLAPALGAVVVGAVLFDLATDTLRIGSVRRPFTGWSEAAERMEEHVSTINKATGSRTLVVADNYKLGANLEFQLGEGAEVYILDHRKNRAHGRARQFAIWAVGEEGLRSRHGEHAVIAVQWSQIRSDHHDAWMAHVGSFFDQFEQLSELHVSTAGKSKKYRYFRYYRGVVKSGEETGSGLEGT